MGIRRLLLILSVAAFPLLYGCAGGGGSPSPKPAATAATTSQPPIHALGPLAKSLPPLDTSALTAAAVKGLDSVKLARYLAFRDRVQADRIAKSEALAAAPQPGSQAGRDSLRAATLAWAEAAESRALSEFRLDRGEAIGMALLTIRYALILMDRRIAERSSSEPGYRLVGEEARDAEKLRELDQKTAALSRSYGPEVLKLLDRYEEALTAPLIDLESLIRTDLLDKILASLPKMEVGPVQKALGASLGSGPQDIQPAFCNTSGWCWENPRPQGRALRALWSSGEKDLWAVGDHGTVLRWNGARWESIPSGTTQNLLAVWGSGMDRVWMGGDSGLLHWDGRALRPVADPAAPRKVLALWGFPDGSMHAFGTHLSRFDGKAWNLGPAVKMVAPWGYANEREAHSAFATGPEDLWAMGDTPPFLRWNGNRWDTVASPTTRQHKTFCGTENGNLWAVARDGITSLALRWDGRAWSEVARIQHYIFSCKVDADGALWVGGTGAVFRRSDTGWIRHEMPTHSTVHALWESRPGDLWAAGTDGLLARWNGANWTPWSAGHPNTSWEGGFSIGKESWFVGSSGKILHQSEREWRSHVFPKHSLNSVWGSTGNDVWAVGGKCTVLRWDGRDWRVVASDAWIHGRGAVCGEGRFKEPDLLTVWGSGPADVWIGGHTGRDGLILHWDGTRLAKVDLPEGKGSVVSFWGAGADDVWAVRGSKLIHWDGKAWTQQPLPEGLSLNRLWGSAANDVWAAGAKGAFAHFDGQAWTAVVTEARKGFLSLSGNSQRDVWALDGDRVAWHWDGKVWAPHSTGATQELSGILVSPQGVRAYGGRGTILRLKGP